MTAPTFTKGIGRLATSRYDFASHYEGQAFRHTADQIDVLHPNLVYNNSPTVELALENINTFINATINGGQGFVVVPDGYNTYHAAPNSPSGPPGQSNFDTTIPSLDTFLNPVFASIVQIQAGSAPTTPLPPGFSRVQYGGIVLIKAGTYIVANTISIPPGITLLGEGYGTKIINTTSLNTTVLPPVPKISPTPAPVFKILADPNRNLGAYFADDSAVDPNLFIFQRETRIMNMIVADNFVEPTVLGDTNYRLAQNKTSVSSLNPPPLIDQQLGSSLVLQNTFGSGRINFSSGKTVSSATGSLLGVDGYTFTETNSNTFCKIDNCFIDGFSIPINIDHTPSNYDGYDFLEIKNCRIRGYGYYNGDSSDGYANTLIKSVVQNIAVCDSLLYGNATNVTSLVYLTTPPPTAPAFQDRSKIMVVGNQVVIDKSSPYSVSNGTPADNTTNTTWVPLFFSSSIGTPATYLTSLVYGNIFQDSFNVHVDDGYNFSGSGLGVAQFSINRNTNTTDIRNLFLNLDGYNSVTIDGYFINMIGNVNMGNMYGNMNVINPGSLTISSAMFVNPGAELVFSGTMTNASNLLMGPFTIGQFNGSQIQLVPKNVMTSSYTVDSGTIMPGYDTLLLVTSLGSGIVTVTLPPPTVMGRLIIIKAASSGNTLDISPGVSSGYKIDGLPGNTSLGISSNSSAPGFAVLVSDGIQWWSISLKTS